MNKYLNTLNAGMFLCDEFKMSDDDILKRLKESRTNVNWNQIIT